jgi:hypothetical protein
MIFAIPVVLSSYSGASVQEIARALLATLSSGVIGLPFRGSSLFRGSPPVESRLFAKGVRVWNPLILVYADDATSHNRD